MNHDIIKQEVIDCTSCILHKHRTNVVMGCGNFDADLMFVGEAPGKEEDLSGIPFVGRAGKMLDSMIAAMGMNRADVFIANICKCRPPENRKPTPEEMKACLPFLKRQINMVKPRVIITLGATAMEGLLEIFGITNNRGKFYQYCDIPVMVTFHPSYCLRVPSVKMTVAEDLKKVVTFLKSLKL